MEKSRNSEVLHLTGLLNFWTSYISLLDFLTLLYPRCLNEIADETDVGEERGHL